MGSRTAGAASVPEPGPRPKVNAQLLEDPTKAYTEAVVQALERDRFMTAEDAKEWGLIDEIVEKRSVEPAPE